MKVLIVHHGAWTYGGAELVIVKLSEYLQQQGIGVTVVGTNLPDNMVAELRAGNTPVIEANEPTTGKTSQLFSLWAETHRCIADADVINVVNFPATVAAFPCKKPIVYSCNEPAEVFTNWWRKPFEAFNRWWVKQANMSIIVATPYDQERFKRIYRMDSKVIPYGVDYDFWSQGTRLGVTHNPIKLLQVGTISYYKNQGASVSILAALQERGYETTLTLAGAITEDKYYDFLTTLIGDEAVGDRVNILGSVSRTKVRELYHNHDILLHPVYPQGGWLVPFEAICTGIPIVVADGFCGSYLTEYVTGIKRCFTIDEMTDLTIKIVRHYANYVNCGKDWVRLNLSWEKFGRDTLDVFTDAEKNRRK